MELASTTSPCWSATSTRASPSSPGCCGSREVPNPMGGTEIRWFEIGDGQRFHIQAGDIARTHVRKAHPFRPVGAAISTRSSRISQRHGVAFSDMKGTPGAVNVRPDGMRAVFLQDPNGYWFEINDFQ